VLYVRMYMHLLFPNTAIKSKAKQNGIGYLKFIIQLLPKSVNRKQQ